MTFTAPTVTSAVSYSEWSGNQWSFQAMFQNVLTWYGAAFGTGVFGIALFSGIVLLLIFAVQAIRQESLLLPGSTAAIVGMSTFLYGAVPADMQAWFLMIFVILPVVGVFYDIYRKR